ncbi:helix-turn-helix transcriptional regulator [Streptomyces sp. SP17BM10]|uniref:helix-turn-helix domain-containing protein n=1 Tax=Streptomyces sp. SP17BM10 TaxID=3002530 RepID=UPI002E75E10B|nr:helix-turn-helix transcriptional regulator [Streptomyces sp. SP17BM10]MEE1786176.1 helix-turn-helix transcriptional regulator [Streptomyces sp. SP17BM10]
MDSPTVLRRRLGSELRRLREGAKLQAKSAADSLGFSATKVSRIESGQTTLKESDVRAMLELYGVTDEAELRQFITLTRRSTQRGWWHDYGDTLPEWFQTYVGLEADASQIRSYESELVPGLFQTASYAREIFRTAQWKQLDDDAIERRIKLRMQRQEIVRDPAALTVHAVVSEAVLRRPVGGADVMGQQVNHLIEVAQQSNVTIQVLPFSAGAHPAMGTNFRILSFSEVPGDIVFSEALTSSLYLEKQSDISWHESVFDQLTTLALTPEDSMAWLHTLAAKEYTA